MKSQILINILEKEAIIPQQFIFQVLVRILAAMTLTKSIPVLVDRQQGPVVLTTASWNR